MNSTKRAIQTTFIDLYRKKSYWMEHPDEVDTQKLADISVQMLSSVEQII